MSENSAAHLVSSLFAAFSNGDRETAERLIAPDFHFTSPFDNGIDRASYFAICWPNSGSIAAFDLEHILEAGGKVAVTYVARTQDGRCFRNTEVMTCRNGQIAAVEVYFGWSVPHQVPPGCHVTER
ncbi:nuclear transport factor 2 family protein [Falsiroseomonas sp. HW251]|uniref:nuclear transport factor 2 family protein n=1 Tax=Falsiroseomonas sp. HW251 TaxID=3390998 RepID=UPI003D30EF87